MKSFLHFSKFKKVILLLLFAEAFGLSGFSNPGDTTWVTVFNARRLGHYGNYDTSAVFPTGKRYRKVRLHYILGRYACPAGTQYCGSWDYTTEIRVLPPQNTQKDSVEIARVITPYATDWLSQNKKHEYIMDVTDYASVLDGTTTMRYVYDGYSWGFTITLKFEMIEGIPPMDALSVKNVYDGYFCYGASPSSTNTNCYIENKLSPKTFTSYVAPVSNVYLRNTVSGHGADGANCAEFCSKYYNLKINGNQISQVQLWRPTCGMNEEYAQTGTWIYERANWCPGEVVRPIFHNLTSLINTNATYSIDVDMQPYVINNPSAGYNWVAQLINYSAANYTTDASIEDLISPTSADDYRRENPNCANPVIKLKNTGTTPITSVVFNYGLRGKSPETYTWTTAGLASMRDTLVVFPSISAVLASSLNTNYFDVSITSVNGLSDDNNDNNIYASKVPSVTAYPNDFLVRLTASNSSASETSWSLNDESENSLYSGSGDGEQEVYLEPGCYHFVITDPSCDGLKFMGTTAGTLRFMQPDGSATLYTFPQDFGCGFSKYFYVAGTDVGIAKNNLNPNAVQIFPNPAQNSAVVKFKLNTNQSATYKLTDISGRIIQQKTWSKISLSSSETIDLINIENGVYLVSIQLEDNSVVTKKLIIQK